ncbi:MAG TPA: DUF2249 domain-containing protein [Candidatus Cybelea sp.]|nr:DUF2249 domain-containing protein [Candidatus Cybelea sp.]
MRLDVRPIPLPQRHPKILAALDGLADGQPLVIVSDHEPRPLRSELGRRYGASLRWGQRHVGDQQWEIRVVKLAAAPDASPALATLRRSDAFADAAPESLENLAYFTRRASIKRHHCVVEQGVRWPYVGVVESGAVAAQFITRGGLQQAIYDLFPGDAFGETALFDGGYTLLRYAALTAGTTVLLVSKERLVAALATDGALRAGLERTAAQHSRSIVDRFAGQLSLSSTARVAAVLLPYAPPEPGLSPAFAPLPSMTQGEIAIEAGTAKEVVSRALRRLEEAGALERGGGHIVKLHREKLMQALEPS